MNPSLFSKYEKKYHEKLLEKFFIYGKSKNKKIDFITGIDDAIYDSSEINYKNNFSPFIWGVIRVIAVILFYIGFVGLLAAIGSTLGEDLTFTESIVFISFSLIFTSANFMAIDFCEKRESFVAKERFKEFLDITISQKNDYIKAKHSNSDKDHLEQQEAEKKKTEAAKRKVAHDKKRLEKQEKERLAKVEQERQEAKERERKAREAEVLATQEAETDFLNQVLDSGIKKSSK